MGIRRTFACAAGAFLMTTVLFAAAMIIAHSLVIPDPVGRVLPLAADEPSDVAASERPTGEIALATGRGSSTPQTLDDDDTVPEITAVPVPDYTTVDDPASLGDAPEPAEDSDEPADGAQGDDRAGGASQAESRGDDAHRADATRQIPEPRQKRTAHDDGRSTGSDQPEPSPPPAEQPANQTSSRVIEPSTGQRGEDDRRWRWDSSRHRDDDRSSAWDLFRHRDGQSSTWDSRRRDDRSFTWDSFGQRDAWSSGWDMFRQSDDRSEGWRRW